MGSALPDSFDGIIEAMQRRLHPYPVSNEDAVFFASAFAEVSSLVPLYYGSHAISASSQAQSIATERKGLPFFPSAVCLPATGHARRHGEGTA